MDRIDQLRQFLRKDPSDNFLHHALAMEWVRLGRDAEARREWEELLERDPAYLGSYYQLGSLLIRTGEPELALHWLELGMAEARRQGDGKTFNELQAMTDDLSD